MLTLTEDDDRAGHFDRRFVKHAFLKSHVGTIWDVLILFWTALPTQNFYARHASGLIGCAPGHRPKPEQNFVIRAGFFIFIFEPGR